LIYSQQKISLYLCQKTREHDILAPGKKMSGEINLQADVGQLTLQGLSAFSTLLATLTADNVNPMAMIQMENLGAAFPINGRYAAKVSPLLRATGLDEQDLTGKKGSGHAPTLQLLAPRPPRSGRGLA
jgi:hypothetical protein